MFVGRRKTDPAAVFNFGGSCLHQSASAAPSTQSTGRVNGQSSESSCRVLHASQGKFLGLRSSDRKVSEAIITTTTEVLDS